MENIRIRKLHKILKISFLTKVGCYTLWKNFSNDMEKYQ